MAWFVGADDTIVFFCEDERITEADLRLAVAVQTTNGASLHFPPGLGLGLGVGVFPGQAFLNHSCRWRGEVTRSVEL